MSWQLIEPPRIRRAGHIITDHVVQSLITAERCVKWLRANGYTVLSVQAGGRVPHIEIAATKLCDKLDGACYLTERRAGQAVQRGWVALRFGCEIRWASTDSATETGSWGAK